VGGGREKAAAHAFPAELLWKVDLREVCAGLSLPLSFHTSVPPSHWRGKRVDEYWWG